MDKVELGYLDWIKKVNEGLTLALRDMADNRSLQESHITIMRALYPVWNNGELVLYKNIHKEPNVVAEQKGLFNDKMTDKS